MRLLVGILALAALSSISGTETPQDDKSGEGNWAVFNINPQNAIVTIDSTEVHSVRNGVLQIMMPFGKHCYTCESPYYETESGIFEVNDSTKATVKIVMNPVFAYVTVVNTIPGSHIYIDGEKAGQARAQSGRLNEGQHRINIIKGRDCWYDEIVFLAKGEKKTIETTSSFPTPIPVAEIPGLEIPGITGSTATTAEEIMDRMEYECGGVNIHTNVPGATILINGRENGRTPAIIKNLYPGTKYRITVRMDGYRDVTKYIEVKTGKVVDLEMKMKKL